MQASKIAGKKPKVNVSYWVNVAIGLGLMLVFPLLDPIDPITPVGMYVLGTFIGMVYMWSTVDSIWPSILGLLIFGLCGIVPDLQGYAAVKNVMLNAFGSDTMIVLMFGMILFGGVEFVGCTQYFARFFLTRKIINGRPYAFLFMILLCSYLLSGLTNPLASLLILWPICVDILDNFGIRKGEKPYYIFIVGIYLSATLGQPMFPFKGAALIIVSTFEKVSGETVNLASYVSYNIIMSLILLICYIFMVKFLLRPNFEPFKGVNVEQFNKDPLPPMNLAQNSFCIMIICYITLLLIPSFLPKSIGFISLLNKIGVIGVSILCVVALMLIRQDGKPVLPFKAVAQKAFSWDIFFLVAAAVYGANAVSNDITGIKPFLVQLLQPLLGDKPQIVFLFFLLLFALITTNFANNAGMAVVLTPIVIAFADQYPGVDPAVICMSICMMVFVAILTPAASPYAGMLHGRKDLVSMKEILIIGFPMCVIALLMYTLVGFPIAKLLF